MGLIGGQDGMYSSSAATSFLAKGSISWSRVSASTMTELWF